MKPITLLFFCVGFFACTSRKEQNTSPPKEEESSKILYSLKEADKPFYLVRGNLNNGEHLLLCQRGGAVFFNYSLSLNQVIPIESPVSGNGDFFYLYKEDSTVCYSVGDDESSITSINDFAFTQDYPEHLILDVYERSVLMIKPSYVNPPNLVLKEAKKEVIDLGVHCTGALFLDKDKIVITQSVDGKTSIKLFNLTDSLQLIDEFIVDGNLACFGFNKRKEEIYLTSEKRIVSFKFKEKEMVNLYSDYVITPVFIESTQRIFFVLVDGKEIKTIHIP
jgi:hypothetical protein